MNFGSTYFFFVSTFFLYADPGSSALIWQLLLTSLFGAMFYIKVIARKVRSIFPGKSRGDGEKNT